MEEANPSKKAKLDTVDERGRDTVGRHDQGTKREGEGKGKEEIQAFTSAPLPLTANSEVNILVECYN